LKIVNGLFITIIVSIEAFFSFFWIGSYEEKIRLVNELPLSFFKRVVGVSVLGSVGISVLILVNFLHDKIVLKKVNVVSLKRLAIVGFLSVFLVALCGTLLFFFC
jgi:hypothetical protein